MSHVKRAARGWRQCERGTYTHLRTYQPPPLLLLLNPLLLPAPAHMPLLPLLLQLPNGEMTADQMRYAASCVKPYGADGCLDITTRANLQLRGVKLEDAGTAGLLVLVRYVALLLQHQIVRVVV